MSEQEAGRSRPHPDKRFHSPQLQIDLEAVTGRLGAESPPAAGKHKQQTLYRHGPLTLALFLFAPGASLPQHEAAGIVTVHVLEGRLTIQAEGHEHDLPAGTILVLAPGVKHDVKAVEATQMLLTVCLEK